MPKDRSFAAKVAKGAHEGRKCPTCGEVFNMVMVVFSEKNESKDSWRFREKHVAVCKCNEKEIYG